MVLKFMSDSTNDTFFFRFLEFTEDLAFTKDIIDKSLSSSTTELKVLINSLIFFILFIEKNVR